MAIDIAYSTVAISCAIELYNVHLIQNLGQIVALQGIGWACQRWKNVQILQIYLTTVLKAIC